MGRRAWPSVRFSSSGRAPGPDLEVAYVGFYIEPEFVVGYGLDVAERYRNLPDIRVYTAGEPA